MPLRPLIAPAALAEGDFVVLHRKRNVGEWSASRETILGIVDEARWMSGARAAAPGDQGDG